MIDNHPYENSIYRHPVTGLILGIRLQPALSSIFANSNCKCHGCTQPGTYHSGGYYELLLRRSIQRYARGGQSGSIDFKIRPD
jgi:hypothetical protein